MIAIQRLMLTILFSAMVLSPSTNRADGEHRKASSPDIVVGLSLGFSNHFGKSSEVDAVSGATVQIKDKDIKDPGGTAGLFADAGLLRLGPGDLGVMLGYWTSFPNVYLNFGIVPRYRLLLDTESAYIPRVEPWIGFPLFFTFKEKLSEDFFFMFGGSIGCDVALGETNFVLGLGIHINAVNPVPVEETTAVEGETYRLERRLDAVYGLVNIGYRLL